MYKTTVRAATIDDARAISEIHVDSWREAYREILTDEYLVTLDKDARKDFWIESLASPQSKVFVAERERALVGWCAFGQCRDKDKDTNWAEIFAMYVDPELGYRDWDDSHVPGCRIDSFIRLPSRVSLGPKRQCNRPPLL